MYVIGDLPRQSTLYKSRKWKENVAFEGDPVARISPILDTWVLLLFVLIHTVVLLAKQGHVCFSFALWQLVYTTH